MQTMEQVASVCEATEWARADAHWSEREEDMAENEWNIPELTDEQRMGNLKRAQQARRERAATLDDVRSGRTKGEDVIAAVQEHRATLAVGQTRLRTFLLACPGVGKATAERVMRGMPRGRRLDGMGRHQAERVADAVKAARAGR